MTEKENLTQSVIDSLPVDGPSFNDALNDWWMVPGRIGSLRLTDKGFLAFTEVYKQDFIVYIDPTKHPTVASLVNFLNQRLTTPYYIPTSRRVASANIEVRIFDKKIASVSKLYEDFDTYLKRKR